MVLAPDGRTVASGGFDGATVLWDLRGALAEQVEDDLLVAAALDPAGRVLATGGLTGTVTVRDLTGVAPVRASTTSELVNALAVNPDRSQVAMALPGGSVQLRDAVTGADIRRVDGGSDQGVMSVSYSPDGLLLAGNLRDGEVVVWSVLDGCRGHAHPGGGAVRPAFPAVDRARRFSRTAGPSHTAR